VVLIVKHTAHQGFICPFVFFDNVYRGVFSSGSGGCVNRQHRKYQGSGVAFKGPAIVHFCTPEMKSDVDESHPVLCVATNGRLTIPASSRRTTRNWKPSADARETISDKTCELCRDFRSRRSSRTIDGRRYKNEKTKTPP